MFDLFGKLIKKKNDRNERKGSINDDWIIGACLIMNNDLYWIRPRSQDCALKNGWSKEKVVYPWVSHYNFAAYHDSYRLCFRTDIQFLFIRFSFI